MQKSELAKAITDFLEASPNVDGEAAPGLKLLRQAAVALMRPDEAAPGTTASIEGLTGEINHLQQVISQLTAELLAYEEAHQSNQHLVREIDVLLNGDNSAKQASLVDIVHQLQGEPAGKLLGFINADYVTDVLNGGYDAMSVDISEEGGTTSDLAIYARPRRLVMGPTGPELDLSEVQMADFIREAQRALRVDNGTSIEGLAEAMRHKLMMFHTLEDGIKNRDGQIQAQDAFITAIIEATGMDAQDADDMPIRIKEAMDLLRQVQRPEGQIVYPAKTVEVLGGFQKWTDDAIDLAHAVAGDLSPANRVMAKAARDLIMTAPGGDDGETN